MARRILRTGDIARQFNLIRIGRDDYAVLVEAGSDWSLKAGRILRIRDLRSTQPAWLWTITGPAEPGTGITLLGEAMDYDAAKIEFVTAFTELILWCEANRSGDIRWTAG